MVGLIANRAILYGGRMYREGDTLPGYDPRIVDAWLAAGSASRSSGEKPPVVQAPAPEPEKRGLNSAPAPIKGRKGRK